MTLPLSLDIRPSYCLAILLGVLTVLASLVIFALAIPVLLKISLMLLAMGYGIYCVRQYALLQNASAIVNVTLLTDLTFSVMQRDGHTHDAYCQDELLVTPRLTLLNLRLPGRRSMLSLVLSADRVCAEQMRRLRVYLRHAYLTKS